MKKFLFKKLIRDKILDNMLANPDQHPNHRTLNDDEYLLELKKKVVEEAQEIVTSTPESLLEELADVQELIDTILRTIRKTDIDLENLITLKREKVGGFDKRVYVEFNEVDDDSEWVGKYREQPGKYVEVD